MVIKLASTFHIHQHGYWNSASAVGVGASDSAQFLLENVLLLQKTAV